MHNTVVDVTLTVIIQQRNRRLKSCVTKQRNGETAKRRNGETAKRRNCEIGIFLYPDFISFAKQEKNHQNIFFQLAKQDICTTGFCIQLSICINIESQSDTEKEVRLGYRVRQIRSWSEFYFLKCSSRIISWDQNAFFLLALSLNKVTKYPNHPKIEKAVLAELFNDVPELSDLYSLQCLPLEPKSYACIIRAFFLFRCFAVSLFKSPFPMQRQSFS